MEIFENGSDMSGFRSLNNSTSQRVLNLLEPLKLTVWKVIIERVIVFVVKFRVNYGGVSILLKLSVYYFTCLLFNLRFIKEQ